MTQLHPMPVKLEQGSFTRAGVTIHYWTAGASGSPAVVLTHGVTLDHGAFAGQLPALLAAGYRVITWDLRGHGRSRPATEPLSFRTAAADLAMLLDETAVDQAVLVGQSFGGIVIQELCRHHAERVAGLVLVGSPILGDRLPWPHHWLQRVRPLLLRLWPEDHLRRITPQFYSQYPTVQQYVATAIQPLAKEDLVLVTKAALEVFLSAEPLPDLDIPILLVRGEDEIAIVTRMMQTAAGHNAQATLAIVAEAGHLANQDNPTTFNDILLTFAQKRLPSSISTIV